MNANPYDIAFDPKDGQPYIPEGYFCKWTWDKDDTKDLDW